uniref:ADP-dependent glucokinase 2 n=1 Tax=Eptatretus burgeri TaxID=7764 RepID=A0A8C4QE31_EPTBU
MFDTWEKTRGEGDFDTFAYVINTLPFPLRLVQRGGSCTAVGWACPRLFDPKRGPGRRGGRRGGVFESCGAGGRAWRWGLGGCQDVVVNGIDFLHKAGILPGTDPGYPAFIKGERDLADSLAYYFPHGAAAERYMENKTLFQNLVQLSLEVSGTRRLLGGNAPVMANRLAHEGCQVLLGAQLSHHLRKHLHKRVSVTGDPLQDDIHLILEYPKGGKWGPYEAMRANRFIVHNDVHNAVLSSLEDFHSRLETFRPDLLVIGGLQMMDNFPFQPGERLRRLQKLGAAMEVATRQGTLVHFELASFADRDTLKELMEAVVPRADSLGMNEQELPNLHSLLQRGEVTLVADAYPRVATVLDEMREVFSLLNQRHRRDGMGRRLSRLHVHTLAFQAILTAQGSAWKNTMSATAKASLTANRHVCGSVAIDCGKARLIMDDSFAVSRKPQSRRIQLRPERPVTCWHEDASEGKYEVCVAPVLVCTDVYQTAGGGDNISAAGLVLQI